MMRKNVYVFLSCFLLSGCGMIDYHPYDVRISGETEVNAHNIERIEANCQGKTTIRFVTMGDSQRWYDETEDFVKEINKRNDIDFVIHGGDMSDFGLTKEFLWQRDILGTEEDTIYRDLETEAEQKMLRKAIEKLSPREKTIVEMRFGINRSEGEEKTQKEVADLLGISQSYISRLEKKIMQRLKKEIVRYES